MEGDCRPPEYPAVSKILGEVGTVTVQIQVNTEGRVVSSKIQSSSGHVRLDEAVRSGLGKCRFVPIKDGQGNATTAWGMASYTFAK
ncbi:energy transducer TonB [Solimonas flava]|uniref:energy transducer TonB n=1 Tax=Solimonas flava TaxID=415849 RepID=UPI00344BDBA5